MIGATLTPTDSPARASVSIVRRRRAGVGDVRLDGARPLLVPERDADRDVHVGDARQRLQHVDVALDQRRLGDDAHRVRVLDAHLQAAARQPVRGLQRLVAVGDAAEHDELAPPALLAERRAQQRRRLQLDHDLAIEVGAGAEAQVLVRRARVAIRAGVEAAAVRVDAVREADVRAVVLGEDLPRVIGEHLQAHLGRASKYSISVDRPGVRRVGYRDRAQPIITMPEHTFSQTLIARIGRRCRFPAVDQVVCRPARDGRPTHEVIQRVSAPGGAAPLCARHASTS